MLNIICKTKFWTDRIFQMTIWFKPDLATATGGQSKPRSGFNQIIQDDYPIFHGQRLRTNFLQRTLKFEILSTTIYNWAVLFQSWTYNEWIVILRILSVCKLRRITHKLYISPSRLYSDCEWFAGVYTSIKYTKMKLIPIMKTHGLSKGT